MKTQQPTQSLSIAAISSFCLVLFATTFTGCGKDLSSDGAITPQPVLTAADTLAAKSVAELTQSVPFPQSASVSCNYAPDYGANLIQIQPVSGHDYTVSPVNNKNVVGTYLAWPGGLVIDARSGTINVTRSETGAKYAIGFVRDGSPDTCLTYITLGGADYIDSVYSAAVSKKTAAPHFNGNVTGPSPCDGPGCKFDYNHLAKNQGVDVNDKNGEIDIKNTLQHSIFALLPIDGMFFYTTIQYKTKPGPNEAEQSIQVKLMYYNSRSSIPASLLQTVSTRASDITTGTLAAAGVTRPPIIIITRYQ